MSPSSRVKGLTYCEKSRGDIVTGTQEVDRQDWYRGSVGVDVWITVMALAVFGMSWSHGITAKSAVTLCDSWSKRAF